MTVLHCQEFWESQLHSVAQASSGATSGSWLVTKTLVNIWFLSSGLWCVTIPTLFQRETHGFFFTSPNNSQSFPHFLSIIFPYQSVQGCQSMGLNEQSLCFWLKMALSLTGLASKIIYVVWLKYSSIWWYPHFRSILENTSAEDMSSMISLRVGTGYCSCNNASLCSVHVYTNPTYCLSCIVLEAVLCFSILAAFLSATSINFAMSCKLVSVSNLYLSVFANHLVILWSEVFSRFHQCCLVYITFPGVI